MDPNMIYIKKNMVSKMTCLLIGQRTMLYTNNLHSYCTCLVLEEWNKLYFSSIEHFKDLFMSSKLEKYNNREKVEMECLASPN